MSKHTPGPWDWRGKSDTLHTLHDRGEYQYGKRVLAPTYEYDAGAGVEVSEADARLIASAPDLLEACKAAMVALLPLTADVAITIVDEKAVAEAMRLLTDAIAKAETPDDTSR
jgi:hypothetical protein